MSSETDGRVLRWSDLAKALLLPPAACFWLAAAGLGLYVSGFETAGVAAVGLGLGLLFVFSLPRVSQGLIETLDRYAPLDAARLGAETPTALVVLDAGRRLGAREFGSDGLKPLTLERLAYAAWLWRRLRYPVMVSGNGAGALMSTYMKELFDVPVRWIEPTSHNTHENARYTARLLAAEGIGRVVLVTHYWHMPRTMAAFSGTGLEVVPAPMGFARRRDRWETGLLGFVPSPAAWMRSYLAIHEGLGMVWYRWRYGHRSRASRAGAHGPG